MSARLIAPRAAPGGRRTITVRLYPEELCHVIERLEEQAAWVADVGAHDGYGDWLVERAAQLRELLR